MTETVWRLAWALPLVGALGFAAVLLLKRMTVLRMPAASVVQRLGLHESLTLSADTCVHLIEVDRRAYLVVESTRQAVLQPAAAQPCEVVPRRPSRGWAQGIFQGGTR